MVSFRDSVDRFRYLQEAAIKLGKNASKENMSKAMDVNAARHQKLSKFQPYDDYEWNRKSRLQNRLLKKNDDLEDRILGRAPRPKPKKKTYYSDEAWAREMHRDRGDY